ncbi:TPA: FrpC operon protein, partial [Neisseria meningitidis]
MRPYATTIYQLFILFIGSVFTMTSCEPVKEQTSFNNPEPMTGFEHTVTFDFQGTKMVIPYGYLARYTQDNATKWLSDTPGQDAYSINLIEISVYYKKTDQGWVL